VTILVAGIGNVFLGDDGFGVEVATLLLARSRPEWLVVGDFGVRGFDLAYALMDPKHEGAVLVDLVSRGLAPGTLSVIEPVLDDPAGEPTFDAHTMTPENVLALVRVLGGAPPPLRIVGCEPLTVGLDEDVFVGLSERVRAAIEPAARLALDVAESLRAEVPRRA